MTKRATYALLVLIASTLAIAACQHPSAGPTKVQSPKALPMGPDCPSGCSPGLRPGQ